MAPMRTYGDGCRTAHALDLVGERWALLVVRELLLGPKRFTDLRSGLPRASPDVLAQRLRELEEEGVVRRRRLGPPVSAWVYELTEWGAELESVVIELGRWGSRSPLADESLDMGVDAHLIALKADFDPNAADDLNASYELRLDDHRFRVDIADRRIQVARREGDGADAVIQTNLHTLDAVLWGGSSLDEALRSGSIQVDGNRSLAKRFFKLFPPPVIAEIG